MHKRIFRKVYEREPEEHRDTYQRMRVAQDTASLTALPMVMEHGRQCVPAHGERYV